MKCETSTKKDKVCKRSVSTRLNQWMTLISTTLNNCSPSNLCVSYSPNTHTEKQDITCDCSIEAASGVDSVFLSFPFANKNTISRFHALFLASSSGHHIANTLHLHSFPATSAIVIFIYNPSSILFTLSIFENIICTSYIVELRITQYLALISMQWKCYYLSSLFVGLNLVRLVIFFSLKRSNQCLFFAISHPALYIISTSHFCKKSY